MGRLTELRQLGIWVPRGFTVTVEAYRAHCVQSGLDTLIEDWLGSISNPHDRSQVQTASNGIRAAFEDTAIAASLAAAIVDAYGELCFRCLEVNGPVAVRSSAAGEDSAEASFAGIFDTYLGIAGEQRVLEAVRRCLGSLFTVRALAYRIERGLSHREMPVAVGVVELIQARASGVAFSIHPVTGKRDRMVIEGNWGWGEAVVQGSVTPDHIEVGVTDGRVLCYRVAHKAVVSAFDYVRGEVVDIEMPSRFRDERILDDEGIGAIVTAVGTIERHYGYPVDVEWVVGREYRAGDPVCIVQARPVTVHEPLPGSETTAPAGGWDPASYTAKHLFGERL
jgi:pyruvate, water dikinase